MNFAQPLARLAACLLLATAGAPFHARAQAALPVLAAPADPQASVPPTRYQSTLDYRVAAPPATSPDRNWVASNQAVAATNSMALTMKMGGTPASQHSGQAAHEHAAMQGMDMSPNKKDTP